MFASSRHATNEKDIDACERAYGSFDRSFTLPDGIDSAHIGATLKNGVLQIDAPKLPEAQPKKIPLGTAKS